MTSRLSEAVVEKVRHAESLYHRLVLVVGAEGSGKTPALQDITEWTGAPLINVSLDLSRRLLDLTERQRPIQAPLLLGRIFAETASNVILLDNMELLFDVTLRQDPLRLLRRLSRRQTLVAAWNGSMDDGHIIHAVPGHPEYRRYPADDVLVARTEEGA